jgi:hypothetical protein
VQATGSTADTAHYLLREEYRLRMLKYWVQRKMSVPKKQEVRGDWRKPHNEELYDFYSSLLLFRW